MPISLPRDIAIENVLRVSNISPKPETVELADSLGRVAAENISSKLAIPSSLASRFDGFAIPFNKLAKSLNLELNPNRISIPCEFLVMAETGKPLPYGYDTVICHEKVISMNELFLEAECPLVRRQNTLPLGAIQEKGESLVSIGQTITPLVQAKLASSRCKQISVFKKPRISIIVCERTLVALNDSTSSKDVIESNSYIIAGKATNWGASVEGVSIVESAEQLKQQLAEYSGKSDLIIVNSGTSKGTNDFAIQTLKEIGKVLNHSTRSSPGRNASYSLFSGKIVIGLSGLLQSAEHTVDWFVKPIIMAYLGSKKTRRVLYCVLDEEIVTNRALPFVVRARCYIDEETHTLRVQPLSSPLDIIQKASDNCNCYVTVSQFDRIIPKNSIVEVELREGVEFLH